MESFRTDLAVERHDVVKKRENKLNGIEIKNTTKKEYIITNVSIKNKEGSKALKKPIGEYITIDVKNIIYLNKNDIEKISNIFSDELNKLIENDSKKINNVLIVGLGNSEVTPDSLGPKIVPELNITRHVLKYMPDVLPENSRTISAIVPSVLGVTGIETLEIVNGVIKNVNPDLIIAIDALATNSIDRICSSIQISNTGISPGAGVNNRRSEISENTTGVKVYAVGVPTVVNLSEFVDIKNKNLIVTPKEIDKQIDIMTNIISNGINKALSSNLENNI